MTPRSSHAGRTAPSVVGHAGAGAGTGDPGSGRGFAVVDANRPAGALRAGGLLRQPSITTAH